MNISQKELEAALRSIQKEGKITAEDVVAAARAPNHPLHPCFDWDDRSAAHANRLSVANNLILRVKYTISVVDVQIRIPKFVDNPAIEGAGFVSTQQVMSNAETARMTMLRECKRALSYVDRLRGIGDTFWQSADKEVLSQFAGWLDQKVIELVLDLEAN